MSYPSSVIKVIWNFYVLLCFLFSHYEMGTFRRILSYFSGFKGTLIVLYHQTKKCMVDALSIVNFNYNWEIPILLMCKIYTCPYMGEWVAKKKELENVAISWYQNAQYWVMYQWNNKHFQFKWGFFLILPMCYL